MEIVALSMAGMSFIFGLIAITRVERNNEEGQQIIIHK